MMQQAQCLTTQGSRPLQCSETRLVPGSRFHNKAMILQPFVCADPAPPTHRLWVPHLSQKGHHACIRLDLESQESLSCTSCLPWHACWAGPLLPPADLGTLWFLVRAAQVKKVCFSPVPIPTQEKGTQGQSLHSTRLSIQAC